MTGTVNRLSPGRPNPTPRIEPPADETTGLATRTANAAPSSSPRNPIVRALGNLGRALLQVVRGKPEAARATAPIRLLQHDTEARARRLLEGLDSISQRSPKLVSGATGMQWRVAAIHRLATDLHSLAETQQRWEQQIDSRHATVQIDRIMKNALAGEPEERLLRLADTLSEELVAATQKAIRNPDGRSEQLLIHLERAVRNTLCERKLGALSSALSASLDRLREGKPLEQVSLSIDKALRSGLDGIEALQHRKLLKPPRGGERGEFANRRQAAEIVMSQLESAGADEAQIRTLLAHASSDILRRLSSPEPSIQNELLERRTAQPIAQQLRRVFTDISQHALSVHIERVAERAVMEAALVIQELLRHRTLDPAAPQRPTSEMRAQAASMLQEILGQTAGSPKALDTFLQHLRSETLRWLSQGRASSLDAPDRAVATGWLSGKSVQEAIAREIQERPTRLMDELEHELDRWLPPNKGGSRPTSRAETLDGARMERLDTLRAKVLAHQIIFPSLTDFRDRFEKVLERIDERLKELVERPSATRPEEVHNLLRASKSATTLLSPESARKVRTKAEQTASELGTQVQQRLWSLLDELKGTGPERVARALLSCKDVVNTLRDYMNISAIEATAPIEVVGRFLDQRAVTHKLDKERKAVGIALGSTEMSGVWNALIRAAKQAASQGLGELEADLRDVHTILKLLHQRTDAGNRGAPETSSPTPVNVVLHPSSVRALQQHFSTRVDSTGTVSLTTGTCAPVFCELFKGLAEAPFSETEMETIELRSSNGRTYHVPAQFHADIIRDGLKILREDGLPFFNRQGWSALTRQQQDDRVVEGYEALLSLYQNNERQANAILRMANQSLVGAVLTASLAALGDSPFRLEPHGAGVLHDGGYHLNTVRIWIEDQKPLAQITYEAWGGRLVIGDRPGTEDEHAIWLDPDSRAKITARFRPNETGDRVEIVDLPLHDINLVQHPIQRSYGQPGMAHLLGQHPHSSELYQDLVFYLETHGREDEASWLRALQLVAQAETTDQPLKYLTELYDTRLRHNAPAPLSPPKGMEDSVSALHGALRELRKAVLEVFDPVVAVVREELLPRADARSRDTADLIQFLDQVEEFQENALRTYEDARALFVSFFPDHDAASAGPAGDRIVFDADIQSSTRSRFKSLEELTQVCFKESHKLAVAASSLKLNEKLLQEFTNSLWAKAHEPPRTPENTRNRPEHA